MPEHRVAHSSGRTGTEPMRCRSRCCDAAETIGTELTGVGQTRLVPASASIPADDGRLCRHVDEWRTQRGQEEERAPRLALPVHSQSAVTSSPPRYGART
jgi:hypothetical protein